MINPQINQIEAVQRRAARSVMNDWSRPHSQSGRSSSSKGSPTIMMQQLGWNTLESIEYQYVGIKPELSSVAE